MPNTERTRHDEHAIRSTTAEQAYLQAGAMATAPVRRAAFERFMASGLPHRRMEDWRWTDLRQLLTVRSRRRAEP